SHPGASHGGDGRHAPGHGAPPALLPAHRARRADRHPCRVRAGASHPDPFQRRGGAGPLPPPAPPLHPPPPPRGGRARAGVPRAPPAGESVTFHGRYLTLDGVRVSPRPRVPVEIWLAGTVPAAVERAGTLADGWLTGQNVPDDELLRQLDVYREAAARARRP